MYKIKFEEALDDLCISIIWLIIDLIVPIFCGYKVFAATKEITIFNLMCIIGGWVYLFIGCLYWSQYKFFIKNLIIDIYTFLKNYLIKNYSGNEDSTN